MPHLARPLAGCEGGDLHRRRTKYEFLVTANVPTLLAVLHTLRPVPSRGRWYRPPSVAWESRC